MSHYYPAAVMSYTDLETLNGLDIPTDYGSGVEYADGLLHSLFPSHDVGLQIGLWLSGASGCRDINSGKMDGQIQKLLRYLNGCSASKVFLRVGYEFDNPSFGYSTEPDQYAAAYRRIVQMCQAGLSPQRRGNIYYVWHSWGAPTSYGIDLVDFYPGDEYVDWIGVSVFQQLYPWAKSWDGSKQNLDKVMIFATVRDKPIMIAESTPFGGIDLDTYETTKTWHLEDPWDRWFRPVLDLIDEYDVSMWCYINCAWDEQPMWHGVGFGETRLSVNEEVMEQWKTHVLDSGRQQSRRRRRRLAEEGEGRSTDNIGSRRARRFWTAGSLTNCASDGDDNSRSMLHLSSMTTTMTITEDGAKEVEGDGTAPLETSSYSMLMKHISFRTAAGGAAPRQGDAVVVIASVGVATVLFVVLAATFFLLAGGCRQRTRMFLGGEDDDKDDDGAPSPRRPIYRKEVRFSDLDDDVVCETTSMLQCTTTALAGGGGKEGGAND